MITVALEDPDTPDAATLLDELSNTLRTITGSSGKASFDPDDVRPENARFAVARDRDGNAIGCGAFRPLENDIAEIKRMYSRMSMPGIGSTVLLFLEKEAAGLGYAALRLETRRVNERAVSFYERAGYHRVPNFGKYVGRADAVCFEKRLKPDDPGPGPDHTG